MLVTLKSRIAGAFALVTLLSGMLAALALHELSEANARTQRLVSQSAERLALSGRLQIGLESIGRLQKAVLLDTQFDPQQDRTANARARLDAEIAGVEATLAALRPLESGEGLAILARVARRFEAYRASTEGIVALAEANGDGRPRQMLLGRERDAFDAVVDALRADARASEGAGAFSGSAGASAATLLADLTGLRVLLYASLLEPGGNAGADTAGRFSLSVDQLRERIASFAGTTTADNERKALEGALDRYAALGLEDRKSVV